MNRIFWIGRAIRNEDQIIVVNTCLRKYIYDGGGSFSVGSYLSWQAILFGGTLGISQLVGLVKNIKLKLI